MITEENIDPKDLADRFFRARFGEPAEDHQYYLEWVFRFMTGHPERYMDGESWEIYLEVKARFGIENESRLTL